jgi:vanillate O-demethylase monooxygenase subunit
MFPKNTWYVGSMPSEIDGKPLGRMICGESIVFFRGPDNQVAAVEDFCPQRGAPLSLGKVVNGKLVCGYHGLEMGCDGKTAAMPCQRVAGFPSVRTYPVVERYGFIWVWPGDAKEADPSKIHHLAWADDLAWANSGGLNHVKCDYRLMIDNLMDLTHETYLHPTSIGHKEIDHTPPKTRMDGDCAIAERYMDGIMAPPFWRAGLRGNNLADDVPVDRWQICRFYPPSHVLIDVGVAHAGHGGFHADPKIKVSSTVIDFITPETESSTWYFWGMARNFNAQNRALSDQIRDSLSKVFSEDLQMLKMQQHNLERNAGRKLLNLNIDGGGVQARRIIDRLVAEDNATV